MAPLDSSRSVRDTGLCGDSRYGHAAKAPRTPSGSEVPVPALSVLYPRHAILVLMTLLRDGNDKPLRQAGAMLASVGLSATTIMALLPFVQ